MDNRASPRCCRFQRLGPKPKRLNIDKRPCQRPCLQVRPYPGYGTEDRYLGRGFLSWFTPTTNVSLVANFNNLNDDRQPGQNDTWEPEQMPSGRQTYRMVSLNYHHQQADDSGWFDGHIIYQGTLNDSQTTTDRTNFLPGGKNTYEYGFSRSKYKNDVNLFTRHSGAHQSEKFYLGYYLDGDYTHRNNDSQSVSAAFNSEQSGISQQTIENIYNTGTLADNLLNRSITNTSNPHTEGSIDFMPMISWKIPGSHDVIRAEFTANYQASKDRLWRDYDINYGNNSASSQRLRQYFDNTPNHTVSLNGRVGYNGSFSRFNFGMFYNYKWSDQHSDSYMYELSRLADMGVYGTLPEGYGSTLDPNNSYASRTITNEHSLMPSILYIRPDERRKRMLMIDFSPTLSLHHSHMDYWRNDHLYPVRRTSTMACAAISRFSKALS